MYFISDDDDSDDNLFLPLLVTISVAKLQKAAAQCYSNLFSFT